MSTESASNSVSLSLNATPRSIIPPVIDMLRRCRPRLLSETRSCRTASLISQRDKSFRVDSKVSRESLSSDFVSASSFEVCVTTAAISRVLTSPPKLRDLSAAKPRTASGMGSGWNGLSWSTGINSTDVTDVDFCSPVEPVSLFSGISVT